MWAAYSAFVAADLLGCSRAHYRRRADEDSLSLQSERMTDARWQLPSRAVEPEPWSRLADPSDPDRSPLPPDDPAAHAYMMPTFKRFGFGAWTGRGDLAAIEDESWQAALPRNPMGQVLLGRDSCMQLALLHSREYQDEVEDVYLSALRLSLERFEFEMHWSAGNSTSYEHSGKSSRPTERNIVATDTSAGFSKAFLAGGQLIVDFANSLAWDYTGGNSHLASSGLLVTLTQPLLRGAFRYVRGELLTQAERDLLYVVRDFARFRRVFYVGVSGGDSGYLSLLSQLQGIRNQEENLKRLERNLSEHRALKAADYVAQIQVDQVFQEYQQGRLSLLSSQNSYESAVDSYLARLGLPPGLAIALDDSPLEPFALSDPRLEGLRDEVEQLSLRYVQMSLARPKVVPPMSELERDYRRLAELQRELGDVMQRVEEELAQWKARLAERGPMIGGTVGTEDAKAEHDFQVAAAAELENGLSERRKVFEAVLKKTEEAIARLPQTEPAEARDAFEVHVRRRFRENVSDIFVVQTQVRSFLIDLSPVADDTETAVTLALDNRLDLMNQRARTMDAWRAVEIAADALRADLGLNLTADLDTDPDRDNPFAFDASASRYKVGVAFDSPLVRRRERNTYRSRQLAYQEARRTYMAAEDGIRSQIRKDIRDLTTNRLRFEITRRQLLAAARQVESAEINLQGAEDRVDSSPTQDLLDATRTLLDARNNLIANWVNYETSRMNLYRDMDLMEIDAQGVWIHERDTHADRPAGTDDADNAPRGEPPVHAEAAQRP